jgi:hypothetical protein
VENGADGSSFSFGDAEHQSSMALDGQTSSRIRQGRTASRIDSRLLTRSRARTGDCYCWQPCLLETGPAQRANDHRPTWPPLQTSVSKPVI